MHDECAVLPHVGRKRERGGAGERQRTGRPADRKRVTAPGRRRRSSSRRPRVRFKQPHHAGTFSTPRTLTLTNRTNGPSRSRRWTSAGQNPNSFRITGGNCAGATLAAGRRAAPRRSGSPRTRSGVKGATLIVNDDGANCAALRRAHRHRDLPQGRRRPCTARSAATRPRSRGSGAGRRAASIAPSSSAAARTSRRGRTTGRGFRTAPASCTIAGSGTSRRTSTGCSPCTDRTPGPGTLNHSRGVVLRLRTGEICTPMDGGVISDTTPTVSWLRHSHALWLLLPDLPRAATRWRRSDPCTPRRSRSASRRHLHHGFTYTLFLYAYPPSQPEGTSIGRTTFRVR